MTVLADGSAASAADPVASACLRLGWRMEELFSQFEVPERPPRAYDLTHLPGRSKLTSYDWQRLGPDEVDFVVGQVTARGGTPAAVPLNLTPNARDKPEATTQGRGAAPPPPAHPAGGPGRAILPPHAERAPRRPSPGRGRGVAPASGGKGGPPPGSPARTPWGQEPGSPATTPTWPSGRCGPCHG